jgi:hypothetical protein
MRVDICRLGLGLLCLLVSLVGVESFADWMTSDFCDRKLFAGQVLMTRQQQ